MFSTLMNDLMRRLLFLVLSVLAVGCASESYAPDVAPTYVIIRENAPFYRYGPQQPGAPEALLQVNDRVKMLRKEFGFSLVQHPKGPTGYVANEDMTLAPEIPTAPAVAREAPLQSSASPPPEPLPLPEPPPLPEPDLEADLPDLPLAPLPEASPTPEAGSTPSPSPVPDESVNE